MKTTKLILTGLAATAALLSNSLAQSTVAVTDPVGYITLNIKGKGAVPAATLLSPTLVQKVELQAASTGAPSGSAITTTSTVPALTANQYFLELKGGAREGWWATVTSVAGSTINLSEALPSGLAAGQEFIIRKHQTISGFLGANSPGLDPGLSLDDADEVQLLDGATQVVSPYFYALAADGAPVDGWYDSAGNSADGVIIYPGSAVKVVRKQSQDKSFVQVGHVKLTKTEVDIYTGFNWVTPMLATGKTLSGLNLDTGNTSTGVQRGVDLSVDEFQLINPDQSVSPYFAADPAQAGVTGWFDAAGNPADAVAVAESVGATVVRKLNTPAVWTAPAQVVAP